MFPIPPRMTMHRMRTEILNEKLDGKMLFINAP
jgi:hypothetical protein